MTLHFSALCIFLYAMYAATVCSNEGIWRSAMYLQIILVKVHFCMCLKKGVTDKFEETTFLSVRKTS